jgi:hypothetical protein
MRNVGRVQRTEMTRVYARLGAFILTLASAGPALADASEAGALLGSWCDDTGYQLNLTPERIFFRDLQSVEDPPAGADLAFARDMAVYTQDFRPTVFPELGLIACSLTLTGPDTAVERCHGPGTGFRPVIELKRCPETPIS